MMILKQMQLIIYWFSYFQIIMRLLFFYLCNYLKQWMSNHVRTIGSHLIIKIKLYQAQLILEWVSAWKHRVLLVFFSAVFLYILCIYIFDIDYSLIFNNTCFVDWFFFKCFALSIDLFYNFRNAYTNMSINKTFK